MLSFYGDMGSSPGLPTVRALDRLKHSHIQGACGKWSGRIWRPMSRSSVFNNGEQLSLGNNTCAVSCPLLLPLSIRRSLSSHRLTIGATEAATFVCLMHATLLTPVSRLQSNFCAFDLVIDMNRCWASICRHRRLLLLLLILLLLLLPLPLPPLLLL